VKLIDRQGMVETIHNGLSAVWDVALAPGDPAIRLAQPRGLPNLAYDVAGAHRLFAEAGLTRGPNGVYRTAAGGSFSIDLLSQGDIQTNVQELLAIANAWTSGGVDANTSFIPGASDWREAAANVQGVYFGSLDSGYSSFRAYTTGEISTQANRWRTENRAGYSNPAYDQLYTRLFSSIDSAQREQTTADLIKLSLDEMIYLPMTYNSDVEVVRKGIRGVTGVIPEERATTWNVHEWEIG
jgi:ABC-type transport system substrate-binding protein